MDFGCDIRKLSELLNPKEEEDELSDDDLPKTGTSKLGPGDIKSVKVTVKGLTSDELGDDEKALNTNKKDPKAIWQLYEVPEVPVCDGASYDPRQRPEYDIKYKQFVTPEDLYLQLGLKTTATASCEAMSISMILDGENHNDVDLQVTRQHLDVRSPLYRLSLPLPHPIHSDRSKAEWNSDTSTLKVTLFLNREFDGVNF